MDGEKKRTWVVTASVAGIAFVPILYFLSLGPLVRWENNLMPDAVRVTWYYYAAPARWMDDHGPEPLRRVMYWYLSLWNSWE